MTADGPAAMKHLVAELAALRRENERLRVRIEVIERATAGQAPAPRHGDPANDAGLARNGAGISRRSLMRRGGVAALASLGAAAAGSLLVAAPAAATDFTALQLAEINTATHPTALAVSDVSNIAGEYGFGVTDVGLSQFPESAAIAGHAKNDYDNAILGYHENGGTGVRGLADLKDGIGVRGTADGNNGTGVQGSALAGIGVYGQSGPPGAGVIGVDGTAVAGFSTIGPGVVGFSERDVGVLGFGKEVGGAFEGGQAQISLSPGPRASHPAKGQPGSFYVDK